MNNTKIKEIDPAVCKHIIDSLKPIIEHLQHFIEQLSPMPDLPRKELYAEAPCHLDGRKVNIQLRDGPPPVIYYYCYYTGELLGTGKVREIVDECQDSRTTDAISMLKMLFKSREPILTGNWTLVKKIMTEMLEETILLEADAKL